MKLTKMYILINKDHGIHYLLCFALVYFFICFRKASKHLTSNQILNNRVTGPIFIISCS